MLKEHAAYIWSELIQSMTNKILILMCYISMTWKKVHNEVSMHETNQSKVMDVCMHEHELQELSSMDKWKGDIWCSCMSSGKKPLKAFTGPLCGGRGLPEGGALGCGDAITFRVQVSSHLHGVAGFPLLYVLVHSGFQQVGILALGLPDSHHTLICGLDKHGRVSRLHVGPHLLKHSDLRPLWK